VSQRSICPICQSENSIYVVECRQCGARLEVDPVITLPTIPTQFEAPIPHSHHAGHSWPPPALTLYLTGKEAPVILPYQERTVLGRTANTELERCLDLTDYDASTLGVSRRHATISFTAEDCLLEDLGSTNGTWLNGNRLTAYKPHPVQNGDVVQLGQLYLLIYFKDAPESIVETRKLPVLPGM